MIATEHQYRVSSRKLAKLRSALDGLRRSERGDDVLHRAQVLSIEETAAEIEGDMREYSALKAGDAGEVVLESLADLPRALIKMRVARGFSQSGLAGLVGVQPQQVQRWEAENYAGAAFSALTRIATALRLDLRDRIRLGSTPLPDPVETRRAVVGMGLPAAVFDRRIMPRRSRAARPETLADELDARLRKLFGLGAGELASGSGFAPSAMLFKLPAFARQDRTRAYSAFVDGICAIVAKTVVCRPSPLPDLIESMHARLFADGLHLHSAVDACWTMGVAVVALDDVVGFNGACWRRDGRSVVALRNRGHEESRVLFDLIHELYHLASTSGDLVLLEAEETSQERRTSTDERRADRFAAEVLTNGRLGFLLASILQNSDGTTSRLKASTIRVAREAGIPVGILANLFAGNVDREGGRDWWAAARSLQDTTGRPWTVVRDALLRHASTSQLDRVERDLLEQVTVTSDE